MNRKEERELNKQLNRLINSKIPTKSELSKLKSQESIFDPIVRTKQKFAKKQYTNQELQGMSIEQLKDLDRQLDKLPKSRKR